MNWKKLKISFLAFLVFSFPNKVNADLFGADVIVLGKLLLNAIEQLSALGKIIDTGKKNLELLETINKGINDSLNLLETMNKAADPGLYSDWTKYQDALLKLKNIYGQVTPSKDAQVQEDADRTVAEAVTFNNSLYQYTKDIDRIGEQVKSSSHSVSPGGAQKLTAETLGVMLHILNQNLRAQATALKLQAQAIAIQNRKDKEETKQFLDESKTLSNAMKNDQTSFQIPRF
ncbi:MAG: hypothetical protein HY072_09705 [Deltaproteobacteria bacterium]|nr:hypothetical protein [Deltaproteobacteria bacterium]